MLRLIIVRFLKINKSLLNLFFSLIIKFIKAFSFIYLFKKYYSHFKFIFNSLKKFNHYYIFKYFIKSLAIFNILLAGFTIFILTDYQYHDYITLIEQNLINLNKSDLFIKVRKYISDLFSIEDVDKDENIIPDINTNKHKYYKDHFENYQNHYIIGLIFTFTIIIICYTFPEYTVTPIISYFSGLSGRDGGDNTGSSDGPDITLSDNRTNQDKTQSLPGSYTFDKSNPFDNSTTFKKIEDMYKNYENILKEYKESGSIDKEYEYQLKNHENHLKNLSIYKNRIIDIETKLRGLKEVDEIRDEIAKLTKINKQISDEIYKLS